MVQVYGDTQVVGPVKLSNCVRILVNHIEQHYTYPVPPHCAYCAAVAPVPGLAAAVDSAATVVAAFAVDVDGATVVGLAGLAEDDGAGAAEPVPLQLKRSGPGTV